LSAKVERASALLAVLRTSSGRPPIKVVYDGAPTSASQNRSTCPAPL